MSDNLLAAIRAEAAAADALTRACARHGAIADATASGNHIVNALRQSFRVAALTPTDMLAALGKIK
jgi:hypothetical protein